MANGSAFPAFIRAEYDQSSQGFRDFERAAEQAGRSAKNSFESNFGEIQQVIQKALSIPRNTSGALDLDTASLRRAADDAQAYAIASREVAVAAERAARATGDTTEATRLYVQAARAAATGAEQQSRELTAQAVTYERLQSEINQTASATDRLVSTSSSAAIAHRGNADSQRALRQASVQAGQQLQDLAISIYSGQQASVVFAQQLPQLAFALSSLEGSTNKTLDRVGALATFLSGPWGLAVGLAVGVLGTFVASLFETEEATEKVKKSTLDFTHTLDFKKQSIVEFKDAIDQLNDSTKRLMDTQAIALDNQSLNAQKAVAEAERRLSLIDRAIAGGGDVGAVARGARPQAVEDLNKARRSLDETRTELQSRAIEESIDRSKGERAAIEREIARLKEVNASSREIDRRNPTARSFAIREAGDNYISEAEYQRRTRQLQQRLYDQQNENRRTPARNPQQVMRDFMRELESRGIDVISDYRTAARQNQLYRQGLTPLDGYARPSAHQAYRALDVDKNTLNERAAYEAAQAAGIKGLRIVTESGGRKHLEWKGAGKPGDVDYQSAQREAEKAQRAQEQLARAVDQSSDSVARLRGEFDQAPRNIDRANAAIDKLNEEIANADKLLASGKLSAAQKAVVEETKRQAEDAKTNLIPESLKRPLNDELGVLRGTLDTQKLLLEGRQREFDQLQDQLDLVRLLGGEEISELDTLVKQLGITDEQLEQYREMREAARANNILLERRNELLQQQLQTVDEIESATKNAIYGVLDGKGLNAIGDYVSDLIDTAKRQMTEEIFTAVFGDSFNNTKLRILGLDQVDATGKEMASAMQVTIDPIRELGNAAAEAARQLRGSSIAANDNGILGKITNGGGLSAIMGGKTAGSGLFSEDIIVNGYRSTDNAQSELKKLTKVTAEGLSKNSPLSKTFSGFGESLSGALRGAAIGDATSGVLKSLGIKQSKTGAQIGGGIGGAIGAATGIPGLDVIGGLLGGTIGGLFKKTPKGSATITGLEGLTYSGSGKLRAGVEGLAGGVQEQLGQIIDALGGELGSFNVSIGQRKKSFVVDPTGKGRTKGAGTQKFASEEEAAQAALLNAIRDGAVAGISAGAQRLISSGKDLDKQLQKALSFQGVFDRLRELEDPVGAAMDKLNREYERLKGIFGEAGASAEEYAKLEKLYGLERAKAIQEASERVTGSLKALREQLTIGDNGRSLRDRLSAAQAEYDPLKARVLAGDRTAYDDFARASQALLEIQRQFSGSQTPYFNLLEEITRITKERIDTEANVTSIAQNRDSPFDSTGKAIADGSSNVVNKIGETNQILIDGFRALLQAGNDNFGASLGGTGFTLPRMF